MGVAITLQQYLGQQNSQFDLVPHPRAVTALRMASTCHVPGDRLAKGVVLADDMGYILAVLPASRRIRLADVQAMLGRDLHLATEREIEQLFADCDPGAVPPVGTAYGLDAIVDASIDKLPEVYFEAGDHETLIHMSGERFAQLSWRATHGQFSTSY
jgi:Ala-tRNA(Pro) deacylase